MLLDELHAKRDVTQTRSRRFGARREERADSDVDLLVDFLRG